MVSISHFRAKEAKKIHDALVQSKVKQTEARLATLLKIAEQNREANKKSIIEKAKAPCEKVNRLIIFVDGIILD